MTADNDEVATDEVAAESPSPVLNADVEAAPEAPAAGPPRPSRPSSEPALRAQIEAPALTPELRDRLIFYGIWGALAVAIAFTFREVLMPFFLAVVVSYVMAPLVDRLERRMSRWVAVVLIYAAFVGSVVGFSILGLPRLAAEIEKLAQDAPSALAEARDEWLPEIERRMRSAMGQTRRTPAAGEAGASPSEGAVEGEGAGGSAQAADAADGDAALEEHESVRVRPTAGGGFEVVLPPDGILVSPDGDRYRVQTAHHERNQKDLAEAFVHAVRGVTRNTQQTATTVLQTAQRLVRAVVKGVFTFFIMLMLSAYLLVTKDEVIGFFRNFARPEKKPAFDRLLARIDRGLSGVVRGQLLICLVNGALSGVGFYFLDLPYWPILTLIATVMSIIPIFGAILSSVPAVLLGFRHGVGTAAMVLVWIVVIHQLEANLLNPKILGDAAHVHPVLVVFALLGGEHLFGIVGALLAVPVLSILQSMFLHYREQVLGVPAPRRADASQSAS